MEKKGAFVLIGLSIIAIVIISGCTSESTSSSQDKLKTAASAEVSSVSKNWDSDTEDDGIIIYPGLKDANGNTIKFENIELPVDIEIWTKGYDDNYDEIKIKLIYNKTATIDSWEDGNFLFDGGIKVSFDDIKTNSSDNDIGLLFVTIYTPDGKTYAAKEGLGTRIKPKIS